MLWVWHHACDVTPGILPSALRASLRLFKIAPGDFVEPLDFMYRMYGMPRAQGCAGAAIARLAALVPKPRVNLTRFHGVFAPNSKHRALVTPAKRGKGSKLKAPDEAQDQTPAERRAAMTGFCSCKTGIHAIHGINLGAPKVGALGDIDIETCRECGGAMKVIACIEDPVAMPKALAALAGQALQKILNHLKEKGEYQDAFRLPESRGPPQTRLFR